MNGISYDHWNSFLEQREGPGWHWPLNMAVALHIAVFLGAVFFQDMARRPGGSESVVTVSLIDLSGPPPAPLASAQTPLTAAEPVVEPVQEKVAALEPDPVVPMADVEIKPDKTVKKAIEPPEPVVKTAEVEIKPDRMIKKAVEKSVVPEPLKPPEPAVKAAEVEIKSDRAVKKVAVKTEEIKPIERVEDAISLKPVQDKKAAEEAKKRELAETVAQEKKRRAEAVRQKLAEERTRLAEARKERELAEAVELKKKAVELRERLAADARQKKKAALAAARRMEHEAVEARTAASQARKQLAQAIRQNIAVSSVAGSGRGSGTGSGSGAGSGSGSASPIHLNQYAASLKDRISGSWRLPELVTASKNLKTVVALIVRKDGTIEDMKIERQSGDSLFDQSVLKALRSAEPLPGFPELITESTLEFALNFTPKGLL